MPLSSLVTATAARHWLAGHAHRRALARPLLVLVPPDAPARGTVARADVAAQGQRVFTNWRALARLVDDVADVGVAALLAPLVPRDAGDDAYDLVAFDQAAARVRALPVDHALLARAHHVLLVNPRGIFRGGRGAGDRWLAAEPAPPPSAPLLFPPRPGRPPSGRAHARPPRVRTLCLARPSDAEAAHVGVMSRWRDEPLEGELPLPRAGARWRRAHATIVLAAVFECLAEVEAGSPASLRM